MLDRALPQEYAPLLRMEKVRRSYALRKPWARLWEALTPEQRKAPGPLPVAELTRDQQSLLVAALQAQMVGEVWAAMHDSLGGDLRRTIVYLDFETPPTSVGPYGTLRYLRVWDADQQMARGPVRSLPPMLRLLPRSDPGLGKRASLVVQDEPLDEVAARLSRALAAPVVVEEPEDEIRLTANLPDKPIRLLLHWVERHTGLQWCRRGAAYVLSRPVESETLVGDVERALSLLRQGIPGRTPPTDVRDKVTPQDRAALASGSVPLSQLSPELQEVVRQWISGWVHYELDSQVGGSWQVLNRFDEARLRAVSLGEGTVRLYVDLDGVTTRQIYIPGDNLIRRTGSR